MSSGRAHVLRAPLVCPVRNGAAGEDVDAPFEVGACQLLRNGPHVHPLTGTDGRRRVEYDDAHLLPRRYVVRVDRLGGGDPVELGVPLWRVIHGRDPGPTVSVGRA